MNFSLMFRHGIPLCLLTFAACSSTSTPAIRRTVPLGHSHNDYERAQPLQLALKHGLRSVEADVWLVDGAIKLSHHGKEFVGTLEELYLEPLKRLVEAKGSVYGDNQPFYVWIDLKEQSDALIEALYALLMRYPMLTRFQKETVEEGAITVVVTGDETAKANFVERYEVLPATRDSNLFDYLDPPADARWQWYALKWTRHFAWDGTAPIDEFLKRQLRELVSAIHRKRRRVRFYKTPDHPAFWQLARECGVDMIGTDTVSALGNFLGTLR